MVFTKLFPRTGFSAEAHRLYSEIVSQARSPALYSTYGVPDTLDGRFELIVLHAFLLLNRLKDEDSVRPLTQDLFDVMFADLDQSLREMGVGDLSVGKKIKVMAQSFYGHMAAYEAAVADGTLADALERNLYGTVQADPVEVEKMRDYVVRQRQSLESADLEAFRAGHIPFVKM
jgi:cytochrome b pre-mRNA-processing protein 3